jgi:phenylalanyl-tRNA synthetase beta chain
VLERAAFLLERLAGGSVAAGCLDCYPVPSQPRVIRLRPGRVNSLLGTNLDAGEMARCLGLLQLPAALASDGSLDVLIPTFRPDLEGEADLAEEVARMIGFDAIQESPAMVPARPVNESPLAALTRELKQCLADAGLCEAISLSFAPSSTAGAVLVANPLAEENGALRRNLADGLLDALQFNLQRQNRPPRFFELGRVFSPDKATGAESPFSFAGMPIQPYHAAFLLAGAAGSDWRHGNRPVDFHTARGLVESLAVRLGLPLTVRPALPEGLELPATAHPVRRAGIYAGENCIGYVAELAPDVPFLKKFPVAVAFGEFDLEQVAALPRPRIAARALPSIPKAQRDLAFLLPVATRYETVEAAIRTAGIETLESVALFDLFAGKSLPPDRKSMAFSLAFRHPERTLTDEEVEAAVKTIVERVRAVGGELR